MSSSSSSLSIVILRVIHLNNLVLPSNVVLHRSQSLHHYQHRDAPSCLVSLPCSCIFQWSLNLKYLNE
ncbi:hypothetical protein HN51_068395 [Arachis hypogaea]